MFFGRLCFGRLFLGRLFLGGRFLCEILEGASLKILRDIRPRLGRWVLGRQFFGRLFLGGRNYLKQTQKKTAFLGQPFGII